MFEKSELRTNKFRLILIIVKLKNIFFIILQFYTVST